MKRHASKFLRSISKARAWYGFALLLCIVVIGLPRLSVAASLTSPVSVLTGTQYGGDDDLGIRQETQVGEDGWASPFGQSKHRRIVYMEPPGGKKLLVAAVVNNSSTLSGCSGAYPVCRLEFRVSANNGLTWSQALLGSTPYLPIMGPKFDYSIYPDPNGEDLWVSYTDGVVTSTWSYLATQIFTNSKIQKLKLDSTTKLAWTLDASERPAFAAPACTGVPAASADCSVPTAVGIEVSGSVSRVWAAITSTNIGYVSNRNTYLVYKSTSDFGNTAVSWTMSDLIGANRIEENGGSKVANEYGASVKFTFFPLGTGKFPVIVKSNARRDVNCYNLETASPGYPNPTGISLMALRKEGAPSPTWRQQNGNPSQEVSATFPFYYYSNVTCALTDPLKALIVPPFSAFPIDFSAAAFPDPANPNKGRVVVAYLGGVDPTGVSHGGQIRIATCDITIQTPAQNGPGSTITCPIKDQIIAAGYGSLSVGFYEGVPWVAYAQGVNTTPSQLHFTKETAYVPATSTWTWAEQTGVSYNKNVMMPSVPAYIPSGAITTNSGYIPTIWSESGGKRVSFAANSGGTTIGTNPKVSSNAVWGYGWASNFGWLSLNCINKPDSDCTTLFGTGIGSVAASSTTDTPNESTIAPTSANTFPLGGFAWSSNAGFLSLERRDSIYDCGLLASCGDADVLTDDNNYGLPPGAPYRNYTTTTPAATVTITTANQLNITSGDCSSFPVGKSIAVGIDYTVVKGCTTTVVDISGEPLKRYTSFPVPNINVYQVDPNVPLAKYDISSQHVYGWGRFINLCNYDTTTFRCKDKDAGWVRLRGYYTTGAPSTLVTAQTTTSLRTDDTCVNFPVNAIISAGDTYARVTGCAFNIMLDQTVITLDPNAPLVATGVMTVYTVTGKDYGLDAFWTGDHYELAGWAWSNEYGWVRFNPLIFIGFAWLETLFGNVYSSGQYDTSGYISGTGDVLLPNAVDLSENRYNTCGVSGDKPCYVSTYRIDARGLIDGLTFSGTNQDVSGPGSAAGNIQDVQNDPKKCGSGANEVYCKLQGDTTALQSYLLRNGVTGPRFPTVGGTTVSYRNALGKLDVGGLTTIPTGFYYAYGEAVSGTKGYSGYFGSDKNRFGNVVYKTKLDTNDQPVHWTINELSGWKNPTWQNASTPVLPLNTLVARTANEYAPLRSQVVHIQGNLTVDGEEGVYSAMNLTSGTLNISGATGTFPSSAALIPATTSSYASCAGCALVVDPGGSNEEYFSYTTYTTGTQQFGGVKRIATVCASGCSHTVGEKVRWVWRLPYMDNGTGNIAQRATVVVDGDLNIQYNIIAADPKNDPDINTPFTANSIRDLPTIAFIVKGNVNIDPKVNKVTAALIVTSRDSSTGHEPDTPSCPTAAAYSNNCGGALKTGNDNDSSICNAGTKVCRPLTIIGLLFARQFNFQRIGNLESNQKSAEKIIADERLFLNPPPGMEDVTKALSNPQRTLP